MKNIFVLFISFFSLSSILSAEIRESVIEYRDGDTVLQGLLVWDSKVQGKRPGILLVHEWWGHNDYIKTRAWQYAALGYVSFALDMYGKGVMTKEASVAQGLSKPFYEDRALMRRRAAAGLTQLAQSPLVDGDKIAALGYCFGGTTALELARSNAPIRGAISFHGGLGSGNMPTASPLKPQLLVFNGADDSFVSDEEQRTLFNELKQAQADYTFVNYSKALHAFTNPNAGSYGIPGIAYNKRADTLSTEQTKDFLEGLFQN